MMTIIATFVPRAGQGKRLLEILTPIAQLTGASLVFLPTIFFILRATTKLLSSNTTVKKRRTANI